MKSSSNFIPQNINDVSSFSNFDKIVQREFNMEIFINFEDKCFEGSTEILFEVLDSTEKKVILDTKKLDIQCIYLVDKLCKYKNQELKFKLHTDHPSINSLGAPLEVYLPELIEKKFTLMIFFRTLGGDGIQFLEKEQTLTKNKPYVYTQGEFILTRTTFPCQDTPSSKVIFKNVDIICEEGIDVVFGGQLVSKQVLPSYKLKRKNKFYNNCLKYSFTQKHLICTYLWAIIAGEIGFKKITDNYGIYAEKPFLDKAAQEFPDCEKYIKIGEQYLDYPYVWGDYNILILPNIFLFGGKENPNLTCLSPGLVLGDKSYTSTVIHEIMHSWTGNLVSPKDWNNFWMNEGFTQFLSRKVVQIYYGREQSLLQSEYGYNEMIYAIDSFEKDHLYTALFPDFKDEDPDDAFSYVPYEKGFNLLHHLETILGEDNFRDILRAYIKKYAFKSVEFEDFKNVLEQIVKEKGIEDKLNRNNKKFDWNYWVYKPGHLDKEAIGIDFETNESKKAKLLYKNIFNSTNFSNDELNNAKILYDSLDYFAKIIFLNCFLKSVNTLSNNSFSILKKIIDLNNGDKHPEVGYIFYQIAFIMKDEDSTKSVERFLQIQRRMKIIRPVYVELYKFKKNLCLEILNRNKHLYFAVPVRLMFIDFEKIDKELI